MQRAIVYLVGGIFVLGYSIYQYFDLLAWQSAGGTRYIGRTTLALYRTFGPTGVLLAGIAGGLLCIAAGILTLRRASQRR